MLPKVAHNNFQLHFIVYLEVMLFCVLILAVSTKKYICIMFIYLFICTIFNILYNIQIWLSSRSPIYGIINSFTCCSQTEAESKEKHDVWDPMPQLTKTSPYVHPEST